MRLRPALRGDSTWRLQRRATLLAGARLCAAPLLGWRAAAAADDAAPAVPPASPSPRVESLLQRMTLEEKVGQLSLYAPADSAPLANPAAGGDASVTSQDDDIRAGRVMGLFNGPRREARLRAQRLAVNESRLGIPLLFGADVIHGYRTVFPVPLAEAASWDPALAERTARAAAEEAAADGFRWTFAPMVDIARDARWGRGVEGAGEDVLLGREFAAARVRGFQGPDLARADAMLATPKHFAAYGAAEGGLDYNTVDISERTLREVYLPPFRAALDAGALAVMSAFNEIAGVPSNANPALLTGVLCHEWAFTGLVVSDYTADAELVAHGVAADERGAARLAFLAGTDVSMQSGLYARHLPSLVATGEVPMSRIDEAVRRVLRVKERLGLFDAPMRGLDPSEAAPAFVDRTAHRALAREAAQRSIVLLKNEGDLLPLPRAGRRIALIGPFATGTADLDGPWTLFAGSERSVPLDEGLRAALADPALLSVVRGSGVSGSIEGGIEAAVAVARGADIVLLAIGESAGMSGEARSRSDIVVPEAQQRLAAAVAATGRPVVVLLRTGRALALQGAVRDAPAIVVTWFLGAETGHAVADVLFGAVSPSGRLPVSFPQTPGQVPWYYAHKRSGRPLPVDRPQSDYKLRYMEATNDALYPFGHGLGYGRVRYGAPVLSSPDLAWDGTLRLAVQVTNDGARAADETVQLYIGQRAARITRPVRELKAHRRVRLAPGETAEVAFTLTRDDLAFLGPDLRPMSEPGEIDVWLAPSSATGAPARFRLLPPGDKGAAAVGTPGAGGG